MASARASARARRHHGGAGRARSRQGHRLGHRSDRSSRWSCSPTERSTRFSAFRPSRRSCAPASIGHVIVNSAVDRPWSQYFCCMLVGQPGIRPRSSDCDQAGDCAPSSRPPTSAPPSRSGRRSAGRWWVHQALRLRAPDADRAAVRQLAGVRPRGHAALLRAAPARGRHDQVEPRTSSSPRAPTGASSTSSSAS